MGNYYQTYVPVVCDDPLGNHLRHLLHLVLPVLPLRMIPQEGLSILVIVDTSVVLDDAHRAAVVTVDGFTQTPVLLDELSRQDLEIDLGGDPAILEEPLIVGETFVFVFRCSVPLPDHIAIKHRHDGGDRRDLVRRPGQRYLAARKIQSKSERVHRLHLRHGVLCSDNREGERRPNEERQDDEGVDE